ncbi:MAG: hypothetical protein RJB38_249, partial [Pseudomonadota bacterium]
TLEIPKKWQGSAVALIIDGVSDIYEIFINGKRIVRHGDGKYESYSAWQMRDEISQALEYGKPNVLAIKVTRFSPSEGGTERGGLWRRVILKRSPPLEQYRQLIAEPLLADYPEWTRIYWEAWRMAWEKVSFSTTSRFVEAYMDEGFNEQVYQWDTGFMTLFGRYGLRLFPVMASLDNFYLKQTPEGYIQRSYSETTGEIAEIPSSEEPAVNPPIFSWVELQYAKSTGDTSRLARVYPHLVSYFNWIERHLKTPQSLGLYFQTGMGCGMDNLPRGDAAGTAWIDMSAQQALAAKSLAGIAELLGKKSQAQQWSERQRSINEKINALLWSEKEHFYYDLQRNGKPGSIKHIGAYWTLLAETASQDRAAAFINHLKDPNEFARPFVFPTLAASEPAFRPEGGYWLGAIWAPTNYVTIKGLAAYGEHTLAYNSAKNFMSLLSRVYHLEVPAELKPKLKKPGLPMQSLWENYSSEYAFPGRYQNPGKPEQIAARNFVGWTGVGPITLLIENVIGITPIGIEQAIEWRMSEPGEIGLKNLALTTDTLVSLRAQAREQDGSRKLEIETNAPFELRVILESGTKIIAVPAGKSTFTVK